MCSRVIAGGIATLIALPLVAFAQNSLEAEIRADLTNDPRTAQMSQGEIDELVAALAQEASQTGVADDYIEGKQATDFASLFAAPVPAAGYQISPLVIALTLLFLALLSVAFFVVTRRSRRGKHDFDEKDTYLTSE